MDQFIHTPTPTPAPAPTSLTSVFWDINLCPVPPSFNPRRVRPCIKRFLENRGYSGLVIITAFGVLQNVPDNILRGVFSSGISLTNVPYGSAPYEIGDIICEFADAYPPPANIMVISDPNIFSDVSEYLRLTGHHLLQPCPYDSLQSLLEQDSVAPEETVECWAETVESPCWECLLCCRDPPDHVFENFITHLHGDEHEQLLLKLLNENNAPPPPDPPVSNAKSLMTWDWCPPPPTHYNRSKKKALTLVFWDINTCPVPRCSDAPLVGPSIKRFLLNKGYVGPSIIIAVGLLEKVDVDILKGVSSSGITLTSVPYGSSDIELLACDFTNSHMFPFNIMVISDAKISGLTSRYLKNMDCNLLKPFPYSSLQRFLLADSGALEKDKCSGTGESAYWFCSVCYPGLAYRGFDNLTVHLSSEQHQFKVFKQLENLLQENVGHLLSECHYQEAVTLVFWDINTCPVPSSCDPRLVGPGIKRFLKNKGYSGPLTITAVGVLTDVPDNILRGVYSGGISLDNNHCGRSSVNYSVRDYTSANPPPAIIMVIGDPGVLLSISDLFSYKGGYKFLPYDSILSFLPAGELEGDNCSETGESASCVCSDCCRGNVEKDFEKFSMHLSSRAHKRAMLDWLPRKSRFSLLQEDASHHGGESSKGKVQETEDVNKKKNKRKMKRNIKKTKALFLIRHLGKCKKRSRREQEQRQEEEEEVE
ncbi:uncharacterized protein LOC17885617 isoform X2 [Capsella rubella]|uniref:uncharacterized protein LOC17885617 isoform X2 n=1 Tax=Capsella rubella TaxID=81985 RepID=UPI000CD552FA|nr:uncharacterized protein LOC17885617 isoform X2 [Capsella rubella]